MTEPANFSALPAWLEVTVAAITGAVIAVATMIKLGFNFNSRLQRIENQDLETLMKAHISDDWHENRAPMLQTRVFAALEKIQEENRIIGQNIAILMERDRVGQRMEKIISALNQQAMSPKD